MSIESDILNVVKNYFANSLDINESLGVIATYLSLDDNFCATQIGDELFKFADNHCKHGNYIDGKLYYRYIIVLYDSYDDLALKSVKIHRKLGDCLLKEGNYCDANSEYKQAYDKVITNKSEFVEEDYIKAANLFLNLQFKSLEALHDYENAEQVMKKSVELLESEQNNENRYMALGEAYFKLGRVNEENRNFQVASTNYARAIENMFMCPIFDYDGFCKLADKIAVCCSKYYNIDGLSTIEWLEYTIDLLQNYEIAAEWFANMSVINSIGNNYESAADAKYLQAKCHVIKQNYSNAAINFMQAIQFYKKCDEPHFGEIIKLSMESGSCYVNLLRFSAAIEAYINLLEYYSKQTMNCQQSYFDKYNFALIYHELGYCYFKVKQYDNSIKYFLQSNDLFEDIEKYSKDSTDQSSCDDIMPNFDIVQKVKYPLSASYYLLGDCYKQLYQHSDAKKCYLQSIEILKQNEKEDIYDDIGWAFLRLAQENNLIKKSESKKYYESAVKYFEKDKNIIMKICTLGLLSLIQKTKDNTTNQSKSSKIFDEAYNELQKLISFDKHINENNITEFFDKISEYFMHNNLHGKQFEYFLAYLTIISQPFFRKNDLKLCKKYILLLINWCSRQKSVDVMRVQELYNILGYITFREQDFYQSIDYFLKCSENNEIPTVAAHFLSLAHKELAHVEIGQKWEHLNKAEGYLKNYISNNGNKCSKYEIAILNYHLAAVKLDKEEPMEASKFFSDSSSVFNFKKESIIDYECDNTYLMDRSNNRGICFICNNLNIDTSDLESLFNSLKYDVIKLKSITIELLDEIRSCEQLARYDVFVMMVFAFGNNSQIKLFDDSDVEIDSVAIEFFNNMNCEYLRAKPKIFIYHTYREHDGFAPFPDSSDEPTFFNQLNQFASYDNTNEVKDPYLVQTSDIFIWNFVTKDKSFKQQYIYILDIIEEYGKNTELLELSKICEPTLSKYQVSLNVKAIGWRKNFNFSLTSFQSPLIFEDKNSDQKRLCLILENNLYDPYSFILKRNARQGSICDVNSIASKFLQLNYKVILIRDKTGEEIQTFFANFANDETLMNFESLIVFVLSHGDKGGVIYGIDEVPVLIHRHILRPIDDCKYLTGKPKVIVIQACRGDDETFGEVDSLPVEDDKDDNVNHSSYSDMVIWYSTLEDYVSHRDVEFGTRFISSLIQVIDDHNDGIELFDLMKKSNRLLMQKFSKKSEKQTSELVMHGWHHNYYFKQQE